MKKFFSILLISSLFLLIILGIYYAYFFQQQQQHLSQQQRITLTREGVLTQIQELNRLETMAFHIDTVVNSEKQGTWYKLWQDHEKSLFIVKGEVIAGVDLAKLTAHDVTVSPDGQKMVIDLPATEIFSISLTDIQMYDYQRGWLNFEPNNPALLQDIQNAARMQVKHSACQAQILKLANDNARKQVTRLFELTQMSVSVQSGLVPSC